VGADVCGAQFDDCDSGVVGELGREERSHFGPCAVGSDDEVES